MGQTKRRSTPRPKEDRRRTTTKTTTKSGARTLTRARMAVGTAMKRFFVLESLEMTMERERERAWLEENVFVRKGGWCCGCMSLTCCLYLSLFFKVCMTVSMLSDSAEASRTTTRFPLPLLKELN